MAATRKRRIFIGMIWFVGLMVGLILSLPLWFPWILRPLAERYGVHYAGYERGGYGRMVLHNVRFTNQTIHFQAARVETLLPNAYLWQRYLVHTPETVFQASSWTLQIRPAGGASRKGPKPVYSQFQSIETNLARVLSFVPKVALTNGVIDALGQTMTVPYANFSTSGLSAHLVFPKYAQSATLRALLKDGFPSNVQLDSDSLQVNAKVAITRDSSSLRFEATATWLTNRIEAGAQFSPSGFLPDKAYFQAKAFKIPAEVHKLPQFSDFHGSLSGEWLTNGFAVDVSGLATPRVAQQVPPLTLVLRAVGDTNAIFFERAKVSAPWMYAELSEKTRVQFAPPFLTKPTALKLYLDLNRQPWFASRGVLRGEAMLRPGDGKLPPATFNVSGSGIQVSNIQAKSLSVTGAMQWPWLDIPKAVAEFGDGSLLSAQAKFNLEKQEVQNGSVSLVGRFGQQWLPANFSYTNAAVSLQFSGPFKSLSHSGQLQLDHILGTHLCPLNLKGDWRGHRLTFPYLQVEISGGKAVLALQGAANLAAPQKVFRLITLDLRQAGQLGLALQKPFQINFQKLTQREKGSWRASLEPFDWSGSGGKINLAGSLDWPQNGSISASMNRLSSREFEEFFQLPRQRLSIDNLDLSANWTNGPLNFRLGLAANSFLQDNVPFEIKASVAGSAQGVSLTNLSISSQSNLVATAHGFLPLTISPAQLGIQVRPDSPLRLEAQTEPNAIFWNELARLTGTVLENPQLKIQAGGTWNAPHGMVDLQAAKAQFPRAKQPLPEFEQLKLTARIEPESTRIESLTLLFGSSLNPPE